MRVLWIWIYFSRSRHIWYRVLVITELSVSVTFFWHTHRFIRTYLYSIALSSVSNLGCFGWRLFQLNWLSRDLKSSLLSLLQYWGSLLFLNFFYIIKWSLWRNLLLWKKILMNNFMSIWNKVILPLFWPLTLIHRIQFAVLFVP